MALKIGIGAIVLIALLGGGWYALSKDSAPIDLNQDASQNESTNTDAKPWVEILSSKVTEEKKDGSIRELKTGDEVEIGSTLTSDAKGKANIHFESGSVARLDSNTKISIAASSKTGSSIIVKLNLLSGRVWSKIFKVANVETDWEVKTSNAVAVVRGTAFSAEFKNNITRLIGAENTVKVSPIDPQSGEALPDEDEDLGEKKYIDIRSEDIEKIKNGTKDLVAQNASATMLQELWFTDNLKKDDALELEIDRIEASGAVNINQELRTDIVPPPSTTPPPPPATNNPATTSPPPTGGGSTGTTAAKPTGIVIAPKSDISKLVEGDRVGFSAILTMSDGSRVDITTKVNWQVLGSIGSIDASGIFLAKLDVSLGDAGDTTGAVIATWKASTGEELLGKLLVKVYKASANTEPIPEGS